MTEEIKKADEKKEEEATVTEDDILKAVDKLESIVKARKEEPEEEEEEEDEEKEEEEEEKSYVGNFEEDETLEKAIEVSDYLAALVGQTTTSIMAQGKEIDRLTKSMEKFDSQYIESLKALGGMVKALGEQLKGFDERVKAVENAPVRVGPKSIMKSVQAIEKAGDAGGAAHEVDGLPKRQVTNLLEKAVVDGKIPDGVLFSFESNQNYRLTPGHKDILKSYINK